jgi:hypothetical protein
MAKLDFAKAKADIVQIVDIVKTVPENLQQVCFEMLFEAAFSEAHPPEAKVKPPEPEKPAEPAEPVGGKNRARLITPKAAPGDGLLARPAVFDSAAYPAFGTQSAGNIVYRLVKR